MPWQFDLRLSSDVFSDSFDKSPLNAHIYWSLPSSPANLGIFTDTVTLGVGMVDADLCFVPGETVLEPAQTVFQTSC